MSSRTDNSHKSESSVVQPEQPTGLLRVKRTFLWELLFARGIFE